MIIALRTAQPADYAGTEHVTREAFWNYYVPGCNEHYLLHIMRGSPSFIPELDVVAVHGGRIVGNIVYAASVIRTDDGKEYEVLGMAHHSETEEELVVYRTLYGDHDLWVRPAAMWCETVERDGRVQPRFAYIGE